MKDIDFDELDRAVSSVLNQKKPSDDGAATSSNESDGKMETVSVTSNTNAPANDVPTTSSTTPEPTDHSDLAATTAEPEPVKTDSPEPLAQPETVAPEVASASPLAVKRRGKFMDVMHPSHDMAPGSPAPAALPASKPKHLLSPVSHDLKPDETKHDTDTKPEPVVDHEEPVVSKPEPQVEQPAAKDKDEDAGKKPTSLYIDPLELDDKSKDVKPDEEPAEVKEPTSVETTSEAPQTTPFLTDAKVEKRPLGGFNEPEATPTPETQPEADTSAEQPANNQVAPSVPLPRELQPDVVEVEAVHDDTRPPAGDNTPADTPNKVSDEAKPTGEHEKTRSHPLFDTSTYHEPTAAKRGGKKPGWLMWVIGFVVCLAIGGGVGYFLFMVGF